MARVSTVTTGTPISSTAFGNALIADYLSKTDTTDQAVASNLNFAGTKRPIFKGGALPFVTVGSTAGCDYAIADFQDALDLGGLIYLESFTANTNTDSGNGAVFNITVPVHIIGVGTSNVDNSGDVGTTFNYWSDLELFHIQAPASGRIEGVFIEGIRATYNGGAQTKPTIHAVDMSYSTLTKNRFLHNGASGLGLLLESTNSYSCKNSIVDNIFKGYVGGTAMQLEAAAAKWTNINTIRDNHLWACGVGLKLQADGTKTGDVDTNIMSGNTYDTTTVAGVEDGGAWNTYSQDIYMDTADGYTFWQLATGNFTSLSQCVALNGQDDIKVDGSNFKAKNCPGHADV